MKTCRDNGVIHLDECGELHVPGHFPPGFVTVVSHLNGATPRLYAEKSLLLSGTEYEMSGRSSVV